MTIRAQAEAETRITRAFNQLLPSPIMDDSDSPVWSPLQIQMIVFMIASVTSWVLWGWFTGGQCKKRTLVFLPISFRFARFASAREQ